VKYPLHSTSKTIPMSSPSCLQRVEETLPDSPKHTPKSYQAALTPSSSTSPASSFIPRLLRESFSKLIQRKLSNKCENSDHDLDLDESDFVSSETEDVVQESLSDGLPIIPFAYPTFYTISKNQEAIKKRIRKNSLRNLNQINKTQLSTNSKFIFSEEDDRTLDSLVKIAKQELKAEESKQQPRKDSDASYVEMSNTFDMRDNQRTRSDESESSYMKMDKILDNNYLHMARSSGRQENHMHFKNEGFGIKEDKSKKRKNNPFHDLTSKREHVLKEDGTRRFKKGNKYKDDYVFFDFEQEKDYVDMSSTKTKKWHILEKVIK